MMKKINLALGLALTATLIFSLPSFGQSKLESKGDWQMAKFHFLSASKLYEQALANGEGSDLTSFKALDTVGIATTAGLTGTTVSLATNIFGRCMRAVCEPHAKAITDYHRLP